MQMCRGEGRGRESPGVLRTQGWGQPGLRQRGRMKRAERVRAECQVVSEQLLPDGRGAQEGSGQAGLLTLLGSTPHSTHSSAARLRSLSWVVTSSQTPQEAGVTGPFVACPLNLAKASQSCGD